MFKTHLYLLLLLLLLSLHVTIPSVPRHPDSWGFASPAYRLFVVSAGRHAGAYTTTQLGWCSEFDSARETFKWMFGGKWQLSRSTLKWFAFPPKAQMLSQTADVRDVLVCFQCSALIAENRLTKQDGEWQQEVGVSVTWSLLTVIIYNSQVDLIEYTQPCWR